MNALAVLERSHKGPLYFNLKVEETKEGGEERERKEHKAEDVER